MHRDACDPELSLLINAPAKPARAVALLPVTMLAGMDEMARRVERELMACRRSGGRLAVLVLRFEALIEPTLLAAMGERLRGHVRSSDLVFQLGEQGFGVVLRGAAHPHLAAIQERLHAALNAPYGLGGQLHRAVVRVGLAGQPQGLVSGAELLLAAEPASISADSA